MTVIGIELAPDPATKGFVDIVSGCHHPIVKQIWLFLFKSRIVPEFRRGENLSYSHCVDKISAAPDANRVATSSNYPIADLCMLPNPRLTSGECTVAMKWVGSETTIIADDIG